MKNPLRTLILLTALAVAILIASASFMVRAQEKVTLNAPIQTDAGAATVRLTLLHLDWPNQLVTIQLRAVDGTGTNYLARPPLEYQYTGTNAIAKLKQLNTNNFTVSSLQKKCLIMLSNDFPALTGTISGSPE